MNFMIYEFYLNKEFSPKMMIISNIYSEIGLGIVFWVLWIILFHFPKNHRDILIISTYRGTK